MKRKLLFIERLLYRDGVKPFNGVFCVKIRGDFTLEGLRNALAKIQAKHPLLASRVAEDERGVPYFVSDGRAPEIPVRVLERRGDDHWREQVKAEWKTGFPMQAGPLARVVWLRPAGNPVTSYGVNHVLRTPHSRTNGQLPGNGASILLQGGQSDLILAFHHCICDGGGGLALIREILLLLDRPEAEIGKYESFTSVKELLPRRVLSDKKLAWKVRLVPVLMRMLLFFYLPFMTRKNMPAGLGEMEYLLHWKLDKETSERLFRRCSDAGVTVNTALSGAFLRAFGMVKGGKVRVTCPVNIRSYIPEIKNDALFAFALAVSVSSDKDPDADFWSSLPKLQQRISGKLDKLNGYEFLMMLERLHPAVKSIRKLLENRDMKNSLLFSNIGRLDIEKHYRTFEVETIYSPTAMDPYSSTNGICISTYNGQLDFSFISNNSLKYGEMEAIKEKAMELLCSQTDVGVRAENFESPGEKAAS